MLPLSDRRERCPLARVQRALLALYTGINSLDTIQVPDSAGLPVTLLDCYAAIKKSGQAVTAPAPIMGCSVVRRGCEAKRA